MPQNFTRIIENPDKHFKVLPFAFIVIYLE